MMNFEITFLGVKDWFQVTGYPASDEQLFRSLLVPEQLDPTIQYEIMRHVVYRHEDVFFQANRISHTENETDPLNIEAYQDNIFEPVHQLLLRLMNIRTLQGEQEALLELYVTLQQDRLRDEPLYANLHDFFANMPSD